MSRESSGWGGPGRRYLPRVVLVWLLCGTGAGAAVRAAGAAEAEAAAGPEMAAEGSGEGTLPGVDWNAPAPELWFPVGEIIEYNIKWGVFKVAEATATTAWTNRDGRRLVVLTVEGESNGIVEKLYPVSIFLQTVLDPVTFLPLSYEKRNREGKRYSHEMTTFDHAAGTCRWESFLKGREKEFDIGSATRDLLGQMYWIRGEPVHASETRTYNVMADDKMYELVIDAGRKDKLKLGRYGRVSCIKMEPKGKFEGMFVRKGRLLLWVSDDPRYVITLASASVPVASIKIVLRRVRGPGDDFWVHGGDPDYDDEDDMADEDADEIADEDADE